MLNDLLSSSVHSNDHTITKEVKRNKLLI